MESDDRVPHDLETFSATLDAAGIEAGAERISIFMRLPEHVRDRALADIRGDGVVVLGEVKPTPKAAASS